MLRIGTMEYRDNLQILARILLLEVCEFRLQVVVQGSELENISVLASQHPLAAR